MRSPWEQKIENHIRSEFPNLYIRENDRSIIPSRNSSNYLEIDLYIPSLNLAIEMNGETYHSHDQYKKDKYNGTQYSEEMYKEKYCASRGINLINIWSSESDYSNFIIIDNAIRAAMRVRSTSSPNKKTSSSDSSKLGISIAIAVVPLVLLFVLFGHVMFNTSEGIWTCLLYEAGFIAFAVYYYKSD